MDKSIYWYEYWSKKKTKKNDFEEEFFKLTNDAVFGKAMENVRKQRDIKLFMTERKRNYLVSEPNYHTTKLFTKNLWAIEMKKKKNIYLWINLSI